MSPRGAALRRRVPARRHASRAPRIFISYRRGDTAPYAGRLYDALAARFGPENVFMDVDAIDLGSDFRRTIDAAIADCDAVLALVGRAWLTAADAAGRRRLDDPDDVLRIELERALAHELAVVPVCVQGASIPADGELPPSLAPLARRQGIELRDNAWGADVARLAGRLEQLRAEPAPERRPAARRRWALLLAVAALAAAVIAAGALLLRDGGEGGEAAAPSDAHRRLLAAIPQPLRSTCGPIDWGPEAAVASVGCSGARVGIEYHLFDSEPVLGAWYELGREEAQLAPGAGSCTADSFSGEAPYEVDGEGVGRSFCFLDVDEPTLVWTDTRALVGAEANVWDGTGRPAVESLLRQWSCCLQLEP